MEPARTWARASVSVWRKILLPGCNRTRRTLWRKPEFQRRRKNSTSASSGIGRTMRGNANETKAVSDVPAFRTVPVQISRTAMIPRQERRSDSVERHRLVHHRGRRGSQRGRREGALREDDAFTIRRQRRLGLCAPLCSSVSSVVESAPVLSSVMVLNQRAAETECPRRA